MRYLESSNSQIVQWWLQGAGGAGIGESLFNGEMGTEFQLYKMKNF